MRTLRVNLVAPHHIAPVYFPPLHRRVRPPILADVIIVNGYVFAHRRFRWRPRDGSANRHLVRTSRSRHFLSSTHIEASLSFCSARSAAVDARDLEGMSWAITFLGISEKKNNTVRYSIRSSLLNRRCAPRIYAERRDLRSIRRFSTDTKPHQG